MKKSNLLEYILETAQKLKNDDGKKSVSADYFIVSLFTIYEVKQSNQLPEEYDNTETKKELDSAICLFADYGVDYGKAADRIRKTICEKEYDSSMDEWVFGKFTFSSEAKAKKEGKELITADLFTETILAEPTKAIKICVIENSQNSDVAEDKKAEEDLAEELESFLDKYLPDSNTTESTEVQKEPELGGKERLSLSVANARKIQETLLANVFGQDQAVNTFVSGYFQSQLTAQIRKNNNKPQATFLFAGPPGVGKTFLAEKAAEALGLPYQRFDMSEYSDKEANIEFCGADKVYKSAKAGNVTSFVDENPKCVLLFDEIEKAHINVIHLFLQILDAGRIRDNYTDDEVSFTDAIIIFTTNVGRLLYDDPSITNLSALPRKRIIKALAAEINPNTNAPMFPAAMCSRFASGNVVMFNHLNASNLLTIASKELMSDIDGFEKSTGIKVLMDSRIPATVMFSEGGKADARTVKGRANSFFHDELYELFRLVPSSEKSNAVERLKNLEIKISLDGCEEQVAKLFEPAQQPEILIFASDDIASECQNKIQSAKVFVTDNIEDAEEILFNHDISLALCDIRCGLSSDTDSVLNAEDIRSDGIDFLDIVTQKYGMPLFILKNHEKDLSKEEEVSFFKVGVQGVLTIHSGTSGALDAKIKEKCGEAFLQTNMLELAKANKALTYKTSQSITRSKSRATITLFDFKMHLSTDAEDSHSILDSASKPNIVFDDVIGAKDAKDELRYFVSFLKNPKSFVRKGLKAPRGVLLYGPPGTGKTLLAKAMAGESDVTFLTAEGNQFLKKFVGEGADAVHALFAVARKYAPAILFVDEIDAIAKDRASAGLNDTSGDVLTAFLTEMDGFNVDTSKPVFVLAATNYDIEPGSGKCLDAALLRRFDRRIFVDLPNKEERKNFIHRRLNKTHGVALSEEQIENIAMRSTGMSLAELDSIFEMAMRSAVRMNLDCVDDSAFEEAFETFNGGEAKKWGEDSLLRTARHEAGHALLCWLSGEKPSYLTIVARGNHGGYMQHSNSESKGLYTKNELLDKIRTSLGGRAAEVVYYGTEDGVSTGASGDLQNATQIALQMICNYGMDEEIGLAYVDSNDMKSISNIRTRINDILKRELQSAIQTITAYQKAVDNLVDALMSRNHLKENEIDDILRQIKTNDK